MLQLRIVRKSQRSKGNLLATFLAFLGAILVGCERRQESPPPAPKPSIQARDSAADTRKPTQKNSPTTDAGSHAQNRPRDCKLPFYELLMDSNDAIALERGAYSNQTHPATFIADGEVYDHVKVRYRGAWARSWPKKSLKIFFNADKRFQGQHCLNLNSGWRDPAFVREQLAYEVYAACDAPAPTSRMVRLHLNGQFRGLYVEVEQPGKAFLKRLNLKGASLFKAVSRSNYADERDLGSENSYGAHYEKETEKAEGFRDLQKFCQELAQATNTLEFFTRRIDLEKYINFLAATVLVQNWDGYNKNHFLVYDGRGSQKWFVVPWDLDRTFGDHWGGSFDETHLPILLGTQQLPGVTGWNRLEHRFFSDATLRARFVNRLEELLRKEFTKQKLFPILDRLESEIATEAALDRRRWPSQTSDLHGGIAQVKKFIERRRTYLLGESARLRRDESMR